MEFRIKRGDTSPALKLQLTPPINLVGASVVFNVAGHADGLNLSRVAARVDDAESSVLAYDWTPSDTANAESYAKAEFEVTYADGTVETFPRTDFIVLKILPDLG